VKNILHNLVSNAIKYSDEDGLITVAVESIGDDIMISVKDSGIGIPEADQKHLFERFFRANNAVNIQGTGLGLNLVRRYVEIVGGSINFKSKEGEGSTFIVFLPANPDLDEDNIVD
jgi:signal transduction histidine kinase